MRFPSSRASASCALAVTLATLTPSCSAYRERAPRTGELVAVPSRLELDDDAVPAPEAPPAPAVCRDLGGPQLVGLLAELDAESLELAAATARLRRAEALARQAAGARRLRLDGRLSALYGNGGGLGFGGGVPGSSAPGAGAPGSVAPASGAPGSGEGAPPAGGAPDGGAELTFQGSLAASYEIDVWGALGDRVAAARLDAAAAAERRRALLVTLSAGAAEAWVGLVTQRAVGAVLAEQVELSRRYLELVELRFGHGLAPALDVVQQRQQLATFAADQAIAAAEAAAREARLATLLGATPQDFVAPELARPPPVPPLPDPGLPASLLVRRPDLRAAYRDLEAADRRAAAATADRLPGLSLTAQVFGFGDDPGDVVADPLWQIAADLLAPILDGGRLAAAAGAAGAAAEERLYTWGTTLLGALEEAAVALARNRAQEAVLTSLEAQLEEARRALDLARTSYGQGVVDYLRVLDALEALQRLERQALLAHGELLVERIGLCRALGLPIGPAAADDDPLDPADDHPAASASPRLAATPAASR